MKFDKFHPILNPMIDVYEHGGVKCPACNGAMYHKNNYNKTLYWLECIGCDNQTTIFQTAGQQFYDDIEMEIKIKDGSEDLYGDWVKINFDCCRQELRVFTARAEGIPHNLLFTCSLPKWESLKPDYIAKKVRLYLTFS